MLIDTLKEALAEAQRQIAITQQTASQLRGMIASLEGKAEQQPPTISTKTLEPSGYDPSLFDLEEQENNIDAAADVISEAGVRLHITQICSALSIKRGIEVQRRKIEPGLNRHASRSKVPKVLKVGPSTFSTPQVENATAAEVTQ